MYTRQRVTAKINRVRLLLNNVTHATRGRVGSIETPVLFCGPKFTKFRMYAQERSQFAANNAIFRLTISCFVPETFAIRAL